MSIAWQVVPPMQIVPTWNGTGVAFVTLKPGDVESVQPSPFWVWAMYTFQGSLSPAASASLAGRAWSLPNQATATRPASPTAIHGQMSVRLSGSTRVGAAHVRPPVVEYEYQIPASRTPLPLSSQALQPLPLAS